MEAVKVLIDKAQKAHLGDDALKFSQAACNVAHANKLIDESLAQAAKAANA